MELQELLRDAAAEVTPTPGLVRRARRRYFVRRRRQRLATAATVCALSVAMVSIVSIVRSDDAVQVGAAVPVADLETAYFLNGADGYGITRGANPVVASTADGGATWTQTGTVPSAKRARHVVFVSDSDGLTWADGALHITDNAGEDWRTVDGTFLDIAGSRADDSVWALVGCSEAASQCIPRVANSSDHGQSWHDTANQPELASAGYELVGASERTAFVIEGPTSVAAAGMWRTQDGGASWTRLALPCTGGRVETAGPVNSVLWLVCADAIVAHDAIVYRSMDDGDNWTAPGADGVPRGLPIDATAAMSDQSAVLATGEGVVYATVDGGQSWTQTFAAEHYDVRLGVRAGRQYWLLAPGVPRGLWLSRDGVHWERADAKES